MECFARPPQLRRAKPPPAQDKRKSRVIRRDSQGECPESSSDSKREEKPLAIFFKAIALLYYYRTLK